MTEKRFRLIDYEEDYFTVGDDEKGEEYDTPFKVVDVMNELNDENNELKEERKGFESCSHNWEILYDEAKNKVEELSKENKELKSDNDIKFWKLQCIRFSNGNGIILHEISRAIEEGYEVSNEFKQYLHDLKVQNEKNVEKAKRLGI